MLEHRTSHYQAMARQGVLRDRQDHLSFCLFSLLRSSLYTRHCVVDRQALKDLPAAMAEDENCEKVRHVHIRTTMYVSRVWDSPISKVTSACKS